MAFTAFALVLVLLASLSPAGAQQPGRVPKVGYLGIPDERAEPRWRDGFVRGLRDLGYVPGQNIVVDLRGYTTDTARRQALKEFVELKVDVIFVGPPAAAIAAKQATSDIPIVCGTCGDPVENGLAASLARPGSTPPAGRWVSSYSESRFEVRGTSRTRFEPRQQAARVSSCYRTTRSSGRLALRSRTWR